MSDLQSLAAAALPPSQQAAPTLRPAWLPDDLTAMAGVMTAADPRFPITREALEARLAAADPDLQHLDWVAEQGGEVIGVASATQQDAAEHADAYWLHLHVAGPWQRQGVGRALLGAVEAQVAGLGGQHLKGEVRQDVPGALALAEGGGYARAWTRYESVLEVTPRSDSQGSGEVPGALTAGGIVVRSVAELKGDPERDRQLWELDWQLMNDVPLGMPLSRTPLDVWVRQELDDPAFCPELSFVALDPARSDPTTGPYIGMSTLNRQPGDFYTIGLTGVLPAYRGRGVARALKVHAMRALQAAGGGVIRTLNDPPNVAMLGLNASLGFRRGPDVYRYERGPEGGEA